MKEIFQDSAAGAPVFHKALMCAHFDSLDEAKQAARLAGFSQPFECEFIERSVLIRARASREQAGSCFFVQGDPAVVLAVEHRHSDRAHLAAEMVALAADFCTARLGYAFPVVWDDDCVRVWELCRT